MKLAIHSLIFLPSPLENHSKITWNDEVGTLIQRFDFVGFFSMLDSNTKENTINFAMGRLDNNGLYKKI